MQLFMSKLTEHKYIEWHRNDVHTGCIKDLFLACPSTIELLQAFPQVLIIDCTNKTNRHDMSLLEIEIVDVTLTNLTFLVCFANLESERENNYIWALKRPKSIMEENMLPTFIVKDRELTLMKAIQNFFSKHNYISLQMTYIKKCIS